MATRINWIPSGRSFKTSIKVMVEGKKRYLRFRVEEDEVTSNLHLEAKVLFNHMWFEIEVLKGKESVEAFLSKLDCYAGTSGDTTTDGLPILSDIIYCDEENYNSFEVAYDFDWYEKAYSDVDVLTTGDVIEIIKSPNNPGHFILAFGGNSVEYPQDQVLYELHRMARDIVNNHKW